MCLNPICLNKKIAGKFVHKIVPCGKCVECVRSRQSGFFVRSYLEQERSTSLYFLTLTYNNENVPVGEFGSLTLRRKDLINWKKRVRHKVKLTSYAFIGEYGSKTHRPHYHGLVFNLTKKEIDYICEDWQNHHGFSSSYSIPLYSSDASAVANYVSKYVVKPSELSILPTDVEPPRLLTSVGFGAPDDKLKNYLLGTDLDLINHYNYYELIERQNIPINGFRYKIPQYVNRKVFYEKFGAHGYKVNSVKREINVILQNRIKNSLDKFVQENRSKSPSDLVESFSNAKLSKERTLKKHYREFYAKDHF